MLGIGLTESVPFTASFFFLPPLSLREGSHSLRFPLYSRLGFSPAESLVGPKVMLLSDKQWLSLAASKPPPADLPPMESFVYSKKGKKHIHTEF